MSQSSPSTRAVRHAYRLLIASAIVALPSAASAQAPAPEPSPKLEACYVPATGTVYRIGVAGT